MRTRENILVMIGRMLEVTVANGATEAEAASAAEKVQALLQEHNLTMAQVEATDTNKNSVIREKQTSGSDRRASYQFQRDLMACLADCNFCVHLVREVWVPWKQGKVSRWNHQTKTYEVGETQKQHLLVGRNVNVEATLRTYDYLITTLKGLVRGLGYPAPGRDWVAFHEGAVNRLTSRLFDRKREAERASQAAEEARRAEGNGTALVLSDVYGTEADQNNDFLNNYPVGTTAQKRRESQAKRAAQEAVKESLVATGMDETEAWYRAYGYNEVRAKELAQAWRRGSGRRGRGTSWTRGNDRAWTGAYREGSEAGKNIGLDPQMGGGNPKRIK